MKPKHLYSALCVVGLVAPNVAFVPWLLAHGLDLRLFFAELFANRVSAAFGLDVMVTLAAIAVFCLVERQRRRLPLWWTPILAGVLAGASLGLPLLLFLREQNGEVTA